MRDHRYELSSRGTTESLLSIETSGYARDQRAKLWHQRDEQRGQRESRVLRSERAELRCQREQSRDYKKTRAVRPIRVEIGGQRGLYFEARKTS